MYQNLDKEDLKLINALNLGCDLEEEIDKNFKYNKRDYYYFDGESLFIN